MAATAPQSSSTRAVLGAALAAAVLGGAIGGGGVLLLHDPEPTAPPPATDSSAANGSAFTDRLANIEAQITALSTQPTSATIREVAPTSNALTGDGDVDDRLGRLEAAVDELLQEARARAAEREAAAAAEAQREFERQERRRLDALASKERIATRQNEILDPRRTAEQKLQAWRDLRHRENAWNDAVVASMVDIGLRSDDPKIRADVWRQADARTQHDALVPALLQALRADAVAGVREEAAETLVEYRDRPAVAAAIDGLLANETNAGVRRYLERVKAGR